MAAALVLIAILVLLSIAIFIAMLVLIPIFVTIFVTMLVLARAFVAFMTIAVFTSTTRVTVAYAVRPFHHAIHHLGGILWKR